MAEEATGLPRSISISRKPSKPQQQLIMKPTHVFTALFIALSFVSCSPSMKVTADWKDTESLPGKQFNKIFIAAMTSNLDAKRTLESDFQKYALSRGLAAVKSGEVFRPNFDNTNAPNKETVLEKIRETGSDAIFTITVLDKQTDTRHGNSAPYAPMSFSYYSGFWDYYNHNHSSVYAPGYYSTNKTYYLESNLYELSTGKLLWSVQSEAYDPSSIKKFSRQYAELVTKTLKPAAGK